MSDRSESEEACCWCHGLFCIHPSSPTSSCSLPAQVWAAFPVWISLLRVYCRVESRKHWQGWSKTLETQACWVLMLPTFDGSQHNPGVLPVSSATKGYYCQALGKAETETEGERQHWEAQNKGVPSRPRDIFASWAHPLIRLHSLNKSNRFHSFSSHSCKADVKTSAKKKKAPLISG